jgi:hypothetical protein
LNVFSEQPTHVDLLIISELGSCLVKNVKALTQFDFGKYAHLTLDEHQYRFNLLVDLAGMLYRLITATARKDKRTKARLKLAGVQS